MVRLMEFLALKLEAPWNEYKKLPKTLRLQAD